MIDPNSIQNALRQIIDPDLQKDIVSLGFIKDLIVEDGRVSFSIELTTPACPIKSFFYEQAHSIVSALEGVKSVEIKMTAKQQKVQRTQKNLQQVKSIIAIASCKGGVGKSTIAALTAYSLAQKGYKVGLLDADIFGPSVPTLFETNQQQVEQIQGSLIPIEKDNLKLISFGNILGDAPAVMRGPMVSRYISSLLLDTRWEELDYLFIDMPPGTGDIQLTIAQTIPLDGAVIVTTASTLSLVDVSKGILMFESVDIPVLSIINNMSHFVCDSCNKEHFLFGQSNLKDQFGFDNIIELPFEKQHSQNIKELSLSKMGQKVTNQIIRDFGKRLFQSKDIPEIHLNDSKIQIKWQDGTLKEFENKDLRSECRCAHCRDEISGKKTLDHAAIKPDIKALKVVPLGNYAINIVWNDGHSSGIYPYKLLRKLS